MFNQPDYNKEKPQILYRGIIISYELLKNFQFTGVDLKPPHPPKIDKNGRKIVGDGNEYGVYMTDYDLVARTAYAAVSLSHGTPINKNIKYGYDQQRIMIPSIGIVYKINTDGLDAHVPWITSSLKGHYNNGKGGDEWVSEFVPDSNYSIDTVEIGPDTLHEAEMINVTNIDTIRDELLEIINRRKERLELFEAKIEAMSDRERFSLDSTKIEILKSIYKLNGIIDIDIDNFETKFPTDYLNYLMACTYSKNKENIDFETLAYIQTLKSKTNKETTLDDIVEMINNDIKVNDENKENFITRKEAQSESYSTLRFDKKNDIYVKLLGQLDSKINSKDKTGYSRQESGSNFIEKQEQILTDYSGKELGNRTITWYDNIENGTRRIETTGKLENDDGIYKLSEISEGIGNELQQQRKEMKKFNKATGENEQYVYQKDKNGRELYYRTSEGKLIFRIIKSFRGTEIFQYDKGQLIDSFEYDENGQALIGMGNIKSIDENFVENFFSSQMPYFDAKNRAIFSEQEVGKATVNTRTQEKDCSKKRVEEDIKNLHIDIIQQKD